MPKQGRGASAGTGSERVQTSPLPDLTGVDLRELRFLDDPAVLGAVAEVLCRPGDFTEEWCGTDTDTAGHHRRHRVPEPSRTSRPAA